MPFFMVSPSSWPVRWRTVFSGASLSTAVNGVFADIWPVWWPVWAIAGSDARMIPAISILRIGSPLNALLEDQIGEGMAGRRREEVRHAGRDHQPVTGMQKLEFAAHQFAAAHFLLA